MIAESVSQEINTIEEYTLYSLDRSIEGLDMLMEDAQVCSTAIDGGNLEMARRILHSLVGNLHSFDMFEHELVGLFEVQTNGLTDPRGSLEEAERLFRKTLQMMTIRLEAGDMAGLSGVIRDRLSPGLGRFKTLLPILRNHIRRHYA